MRRSADASFWGAAGVVGALTLGIILIPLRTVTSASNLAFVFLAFTIVVAEVGGGTAALLTAIVSALSLNFFLTEPYLTLTISKPDDLVAFAALAACGLITAAFGRRREHWSAAAGRAGQELETLGALVQRMRAGAPLADLLDDLRQRFALQALVLRDANEHVVAAAPPDWAPGRIASTPVDAETLFPSSESRIRLGVDGLRIPEDGGRLCLRTERGVMTLDLWEGDQRGFSVDETRTLTIAASLLAIEASRRRPARLEVQR